MEDTAGSFWTPERMMMLRQVSSVRPSPDGRRIAYIVRDAVMESERSDYRSQIYLASVAGGDPIALTGREAAAANPQGSPDGKWIAFTAPDPPVPQREHAMRQKDDARVVGEDPRMQRLYRISVQDALEGRGTPQRLTAGSYTVGVADVPGAYDWFPDGRTIAFSHSRTPNQDDWLSVGISLVNVES